MKLEAVIISEVCSGLRFYMENETVKNIELGSLIPYPPEVLDKKPLNRFPL